MRRRKLYYVPGLISIIGLPILLLFMDPEDTVYHTVLKLNLATTKKDSPGIERFSEEGFFKLIKKKKKVTVDVNDDVWDDRTGYVRDRKFHFVTREMERMQFTGDTSTVLEVRLGDNNTFGDFVRMINRARLYNVRRYAYINDCFYFIPDPLPGPPQIFTLDPVPLIDIPHPPQPSKWNIFQRQLNEWFAEASFIVRHNYPLTIGFLLLVLLPGGLWFRKFRSSRMIHPGRAARPGP